MKLVINEAQAKTIIRALDLYSRIGCGEFTELSRLFQSDPRTHNMVNRSLIDQSLDAIKCQLLPLERGTCYGICSSKVPNDYRSAYDILQVISHALAWKRNPEGALPVT